MHFADSHCHVSRYWPGSLDDLRARMAANGVTHAVLVQAYGAGQTPEARRDGDWRERDHDFLFACMEQYPGTFAPVALVDPARPDAAAQLARLVARGVSGVRLGANDRSPGNDSLALWRAAATHDLTISCYGLSTEFASDAFAALVAAFPTARIVLEHLASHSRPDVNDAERAARRRAFALARFPHVAIKIPGLGEFCPRDAAAPADFPYRQPIPPYLREVYDAFGPERMLWGSDYPPVRAREGYRDALNGPLGQFAHVSDAARASVFGDTARAYFPMRG